MQRISKINRELKRIVTKVIKFPSFMCEYLFLNFTKKTISFTSTHIYIERELTKMCLCARVLYLFCFGMFLTRPMLMSTINTFIKKSTWFIC